MQTYPIPMVPGPVKVSLEVLEAYQINYGASDLEPEFLDLYNRTEANLKQIFSTQNRVVIQTGEGMLALWGAMKSCLLPGDRVLAVSSGVFGAGMADMAKSIGAEVAVVSFDFDETIHDWERVEQAIATFKPKMITVVHCETPSGTLNPIAELGRLKKEHGVPLLYMDAVASAAGAPVLTDAWGVDLALGGSQKCLAVPPSMAYVAISEQAWEIIRAVKYAGYDALLPFARAQEQFYFPYTPNWAGVAATYAATERVLLEGLPNSFARHEKVAALCREGIRKIGLELYPRPEAVPSPTVTAVKVPQEVAWPELDTALRRRGLVVGGSYGPLAGKVFRFGHMGTQAELALMEEALGALEKVIQELR